MKVLPEMAIKQLPSLFPQRQRRRLMKKQPEETVELLNTAIDRG